MLETSSYVVSTNLKHQNKSSESEVNSNSVVRYESSSEFEPDVLDFLVREDTKDRLFAINDDLKEDDEEAGSNGDEDELRLPWVLK